MVRGGGCQPSAAPRTRARAPRAKPIAAFLALHTLRALSWDIVVRRGSRWRLQHGSAEVDIPNKARFTREERTKCALPGQAGVWQPRPAAPQTRTCAHNRARRAYAPASHSVGTTPSVGGGRCPDV